MYPFYLQENIQMPKLQGSKGYIGHMVLLLEYIPSFSNNRFLPHGTLMTPSHKKQKHTTFSSTCHDRNMLWTIGMWAVYNLVAGDSQHVSRVAEGGPAQAETCCGVGGMLTEKRLARPHPRLPVPTCFRHSRWEEGCREVQTMCGMYANPQIFTEQREQDTWRKQIFRKYSYKSV